MSKNTWCTAARAVSRRGISLGAMSQEIEIGLGKKGRIAYGLDDISIVPSRRTRDPQDVSTAWQVDAYEFDIPVIGAPMDSVTSPSTAIAMGKLGTLGVLDLEGLWTRYDDPEPILTKIAELPIDEATAYMQQAYAEPIKPELIAARLHEIRDAGVTVAGSLSPQRTQQYYSTVLNAGVDLFVIRGADAILRLCQNVTDGLHVNEKVVDATVREYLPFIATENLMMEAVKRGGNRQELHEIIRTCSMAATARMKEGEKCDLLSRLAAEPAFGMTEEEMEAVLTPSAYIGRCPAQVDAFLARVEPLLAQASNQTPEINL